MSESCPSKSELSSSADRKPELTNNCRILSLRCLRRRSLRLALLASLRGGGGATLAERRKEPARLYRDIKFYHSRTLPQSPSRVTAPSRREPIVCCMCKSAHTPCLPQWGKGDRACAVDEAVSVKLYHFTRHQICTFCSLIRQNSASLRSATFPHWGRLSLCGYSKIGFSELFPAMLLPFFAVA